MIKDMFDKQVIELKKLWANKRQLLFQLLNLAMIVFSALMIWKALMCYTKVRSFHVILFWVELSWATCSLLSVSALSLSYVLICVYSGF
jgi:TRAP-type C4-dicarboxylate transport system permease small subunit